MLRQALIFLALSIIVVVFARFAHMIVVYIDMLYAFMNAKLTPIFSSSALGLAIKTIFLLALVPIVLAGVPALAYRLVKGQDFPHFIQLTWCLWLVVVLSHLLVR